MLHHQFFQCHVETGTSCKDILPQSNGACHPHPHGCTTTTYAKQGMTQVPYATTCHSGVVERATDEETKEGKDTYRYITPAHLKQGLDTKSDTDHVHPYATTEIPGFVERATDAEAAAGVDEEHYVNPKQLKLGLDEKSDTDHIHPYATTEIPGFVERATDAEAAAGVDEERYVNPKQLQQGLDQKSDTDHIHPYATTEIPGFVERATDTEAAAGVDEERYVNPKQLQQGLDQKSDTDHVHPYVPLERKIITQAPLSGGGALGADLTLAIAAGANDTCLASQNGQAVWVRYMKAMTTDVHLYVSLSGNDQNPGTISSPVRTIAWALALADNYQRSSYRIWIHVAPGDYAEDIYIDFAYRYPHVVLASDTFQAATVKSIGVVGSGTLYLQGISVSKTGSPGGALIYVADYARCYISGVKVTVGGENTSAIGTGSSGSIHVASASIISNGKAHAALISQGGPVECINAQISLNFNADGAMIVSNLTGKVLISNTTFSGTATGYRYAAASNGLIWLGNGSSEIPGTIAGWANYGGQYIS